jgi:Rnl2 family RNA ligase
MEFKKYSSIENADQKKVVEQIIVQGFENETYIVQEKVHGANFSFLTDGKIIKIAKRTDLVEDDEPFYNVRAVAEKYTQKVLHLFEEAKILFPELHTLAIFGELFGGLFTHPEILKDKKAVTVQKGVQYSPENDFYAFDIKIDASYYLDVELANELFEKSDFFYAKTLFKGSLMDALQFPNAFDSTISEQLGLPKLTNNICEGTIIRPLHTKFFHNGSRLILKNKNEKWAEKERVKRVRTTPEKTALSAEAQNVWNEIETYITSNRLNAVLSKIGSFTPQITGKLTGLMGQDVLTDFLKDHSEPFYTLEKTEQKIITKDMNSCIVNLIKKDFMTTQ